VQHLAIHEIAAYLEHRLDDASRRAVEAHLVECVECRHEVMEGQRVLRGVPHARGRRPIALLGMLAAAAVLVFAVLPRGGTHDGPAAERSAQTSIEGAPSPIVVVEPLDSARLGGDPATFVWRSSPGVSLYQVTLTDERGHVLWSVSTRDTVLSRADAPDARSSTRYYWYVDALRADGSTVSSGVHGFRVR
jgi:hypothetical protein